jgi:hypothetical protein
MGIWKVYTPYGVVIPVRVATALAGRREYLESEIGIMSFRRLWVTA